MPLLIFHAHLKREISEKWQKPANRVEAGPLERSTGAERRLAGRGGCG